MMRGIETHSKVEVYNDHRCFVPAGCLSAIFGELVVDTVIMEFVINSF